MKEYKQFFSEASSSSGETGGRTGISRAEKARRSRVRNELKKVDDKGKQVKGDQVVRELQGKKSDMERRMETGAAARSKKNSQDHFRGVREKGMVAQAVIRGLSNEKKAEQKQADEKNNPAKKYGRSETEKEAARAAERERIQAPEVRRKAAQEPLSGGDVKKQARLNLRKQLKGKSAAERKQGFKDARTPMATARRTASAAVGARVKKEKERLKTDPVGQAKKYASGVGKAARATTRALTPKSGSIGTTGGSDSSERGVRYQ